MKGSNNDWKIKSNSFLIEEKKRRYRVCKKEFHNLGLFKWSHKSGGEQIVIKNLYP